MGMQLFFPLNLSGHSIWFHIISVHLWSGLIFPSSSVPEFGRERSKISPSIQTSVSALLAANFTHEAWCVKIFLPSWATLNPAQPLCRCLCSEVCVWFSRHLSVLSLSCQEAPCHLPLPFVPSPCPTKMWNWENADTPGYLASFIYPPSAMAVAVQRNPTVTNTESIPALGQMLKGLKVSDAFRR